jgi:hypothetical protein
MALPTGSGSEIARRGQVDAQSTSETTLLFTGATTTAGASGNTVPALHIITMLGMSFCNTTANSMTLTMWNYGGSVHTTYFSTQTIASYETFVWSDRFVLQAGDSLRINGVGSGTCDVNYSFMDQNWED